MGTLILFCSLGGYNKLKSRRFFLKNGVPPPPTIREWRVEVKNLKNEIEIRNKSIR